MENQIIIATGSIFLITGVVWLLNKISSFYVCPICAGVSLTWLWLLVAKFYGVQIDLLLPAILMGGSIVGIAYTLEKKLPPKKSPLLWKSLFIPVGFAVVYELIKIKTNIFLLLVVVLLAVWFYFFKFQSQKEVKSQKAKELEKKMEECC